MCINTLHKGDSGDDDDNNNNNTRVKLWAWVGVVVKALRC
jgi:hypothetical protein